MEIHDFLRVYQAKSDEELIQLAVAPEQLTSEARLALQSELSRRGISIAETSNASQHDGDEHNARRSTIGEKSKQGDPQDDGVGDFVAEVFRTYHSDFWLFFKITAPAVTITTIAILTGRSEVREISRHLPLGPEVVADKSEILKMWLINFSSWIVSLVAFYFMFGTTCIAVEERAAGFTPSAWRSFLNLRERLGPLLRLCLVLFVLLLVAETASGLLGTAAFWLLHQWRVHTTGLLIKAVSYGLAGLAILVMSRFFLAVPAVILDDCSVGQALFRSDKLTQGRWLTLAALLAKSSIGGYIAAMCPFWLASFIHVSVPLPSWFPWILTVTSMICVTLVEPTMFVGFALLYLKMSALDSVSSTALASQLA